jgi:ABC-type Mn2+/Zn2+ transport system ATPase subunit
MAKKNKTKVFGPFNLDLSPRLVIDDLSFESDSLVLQFFGKNGTGKSTVLQLIRKQLHNEGASFAFLDQNYRSNWLWWKSVKQNLELSYNKVNPQESFIESDIYNRHKSWLDPMIEESPRSVFFEKDAELSTVQLSGGQLQRIIVLRELLHNPDYFLLDEAFSALDHDITEEIISMLKYEQKQRPFTILSIAHSDQVKELLQGDIFDFVRDPKTNTLSIQKLKHA